MNKFGVKYIAVLHDEAEPTEGFFSPPTMFDLKADADECWRDFTSGNVQHHRTLVVDLDSLPHAETTEAERAESQWLYHYARLQELRPDVRPDDAIAAELVRLREACEAMRPIVAAADVWSGETSTPTDCFGERPTQPSCYFNEYAGAVIHHEDCNERRSHAALRDALDANRDRVSAALGGQPSSSLESERAQAVIDAAEALMNGWGSHVSPNNLGDVERLKSALDVYKRRRKVTP